MPSTDADIIYLGLIGKKIDYSFSPSYFREKFEQLGISHLRYELFPLSQISDFIRLSENDKLIGLNVTIPYKQAILDYATGIDAVAEEIGAANTLVREEDGFYAWNTDVTGIEASLNPYELWDTGKIGLICGTGGASRAVQYILRKHRKKYLCCSRTPHGDEIGYDEASSYIGDADLLINTTPLGSVQYPGKKPQLPYGEIGEGTLAFDLIYNPKRSHFLISCEQNGCRVLNGMKMLYVQADAAWEKWVERHSERILQP